MKLSIDTAKLLEDVNPQQKEAICHLEGPLLVLAGAGSGKTRVVTRRIAHLIGHGVRPANILALTFTNKAASEMRQRVETLTSLQGLWVATFHSASARLLRQHIQRLGRDPAFTILDTDDKLKLLKEAVSRLKLDSTQWKPNSFAAAISNAKNKLIGPKDFAGTNTDYYGKTAAQVYEQYEKLLAQNNALDFDDLLLKLVELLAGHADLLQSLQQRFQYLLIDEYQDTNRAQYLIARMLSDAHHNLHVTGDPDQSIYSWRGADIHNILEFEKDFPKAKVIRLEQNYRSTQNILAVASAVIQHNRKRKRKELWTENEKGDRACVLQTSDETHEACRVAEVIGKLLSQGHKPSGMAIFYRTNAQSRVFEDALGKANIPYALFGSLAFYMRKEVKDILAYARAVVNPKDEVSLERVINEPPRGIGESTVKALKLFCIQKGIPLMEGLRSATQLPGHSTRALHALEGFVQLHDALSQIPFRPISGYFKKLIEITHYVKALEKSKEENAGERIENVMEIISAAEAFEASNPDKDLRNFLEESVLVTDLDRWDETRDAVALMTLHLAKGLEFPVVYITGLEEGLLPHINSMTHEDRLEEERRLCFVGMTRAKKRLFLCYAGERHQFGRTQTNLPSRFLEEIPFRFLETDPEGFRGGGEKDAEGTFEEEEEFDIGDRVRHHRFGFGVVQAFSRHRTGATVFVRFQRWGLKKLDASLAHLERLE